jgi:hypothetical protein
MCWAIPIAAGVLYPAPGILLSPMIAAAAMGVSSVSVIINSLRLQSLKLSWLIILSFLNTTVNQKFYNHDEKPFFLTPLVFRTPEFILPPGIVIVLLWIGGLRPFKYEAVGIVPFVANIPPRISLQICYTRI